MSNNRDNINWDLEDDDDDDVQVSFQTESDLIKQLRKQLKAEQRRNKELESTVGTLNKTQKERIIKDVLTSKGVNAKIASFLPSDIEASEDAISVWLENNADVFGIQVAPSKPAVDSEDIAAMEKMNSVLNGAETPTSNETLEQAIANAQSQEEILSILSGQ